MTDAFTVTVLGCSGSYAGPEGACTGFLVRSPGANVWLDAGPGTLAKLQTHVRLRDLTAIVLTHEHPDHWLEIPLVYSAVRHYEHRTPVPVYGTEGTLRLAQDLCPALPEAFDWHVISDGDSVAIGDQDWRFSRTAHYVETLACAAEVGGRTFVFTADTGPAWPMSSLGSPIHLALAESTFLSDFEPEGVLHLSARQAGSMGAEGRAERLVLTHLAPGQDPEAHRAEAEAAFGAPVSVAAIGDTFTI